MQNQGVSADSLQGKVLRLNGFSSFNEMQEAVLRKDWRNKSIVVSAPTAAGKTLVAELIALNCIVNKGLKVVYTCPLRALAAEHYGECKRKYSKELNVRVALSTGDLDSSSSYLQRYDLIFTTYEKLDSLMRHKAEWLGSIGLLIVDEIHVIDSDRGPTLEMAVSKLRQLCPKMQLLALSATIPNADELARWLGAELVESDFRPVPLKEGVFFGGEIVYSDGSSEALKGKGALSSIVKDTLFEKGKQALVFANTRKRAEGMAKQLSSVIEKNLGEKEKAALEKCAGEVLSALDSPTEQCRCLSNLVGKGAAFHHAGLVEKQRSAVEGAFRENKIRVISATPTLAAGINTPAHTVIIPSVYRYTDAGMQRIPVREYKQMSGRASRPKYDTDGRSVLIAKSKAEAEWLMRDFVNGKVEQVGSNLGMQPVLRMHLLALIASDFVFDLGSMQDFFGRTFYALQFGDLSELFVKIREVLAELQEMGFVAADENRLSATPLGSRVSELCIDPLSAFILISGMKRAAKFSPFSYLFLFSCCSELFPPLSVSRPREALLWEQLQLRKQELPADIDREMFLDSHLVRKFNTALLFEQWIDEAREQLIMDDFGIQPGILHGKLRQCGWLCYSATELAKLLRMEQHYTPLAKLSKRLQHGVKEELVFLTEVRHVGRVRARMLWRANIRSVADLMRADVRDLGRILGQGAAEKIKSELGQKKRGSRQRA